MNVDRLNYLNIWLMVACLGLAFVAPFETFLLTFALLSPLHYFTEIAWLHKKQYFSPGRFDVLPLLILVCALAVIRFFLPEYQNFSPSIIALGFALALVMVLVPSKKARFVALLPFLVGIFLLSSYRWYFVFFAVFMTTIVHTFVFTGSFILHGALKGKSKSGMVSLLVFVSCVLLCFLVVPKSGMASISTTVQESYAAFWVVNSELIRLMGGNVSFISDLYTSPLAIMVMRFVTFVYAYHFANWFSKTSVIGWIHPAKKYGKYVLAGWLGCVGIFFYDYALGITVIYFFSMVHVFLEFPLNHRTFLGIGSSVRDLFRLRTQAPEAAISSDG